MDFELKINKVDIEATKVKEINKIVDLIDKVYKNEDIEDIFIDENDLFDGDDVSVEDQKFIEGTVMQTEKELKYNCLRVSKVTWKLRIPTIYNFAVIYL